VKRDAPGGAYRRSLTASPPRPAFEPDWDPNDPEHWRNPPRILGSDPKDPRDKIALLIRATRDMESLERRWRQRPTRARRGLRAE